MRQPSVSPCARIMDVRLEQNFLCLIVQRSKIPRAKKRRRAI
jgi:hypothetical protein